MSSYPKLEQIAREQLSKAILHHHGRPIGTVAARDPHADRINYHHVFVRDFYVSALAFLQNGETEIVANFLTAVARLQSRDVHMDCFRPGRGLMPASFTTSDERDDGELVADFGERAIAKVSPIDSGFWWLLTLRAYIRATGDRDLAESPLIQDAIRLVLELVLTTRFEMFPTLLVPDGSFMIDRRMGVYGHPLEIQCLFFGALRSALEVLPDTAKNRDVRDAAQRRIEHLIHHVRTYFWLDFPRLNDIYRYKVEEYSEHAINVFNIYPASIPEWIYDWLPDDGGYFVGNLGPGRMDFRFFTAGNLLAVLTGMATAPQATALLNLIERNWDDLVGAMPINLVYPALDGDAWRLHTGSDTKNAPWSYHNGGSWPVLLWSLTAVAVRCNRPELAERAVAIAARRLEKDRWPEYYDGRANRLVGKEARVHQTWTIAGFLTALGFLDDPDRVDTVLFPTADDSDAC